MPAIANADERWFSFWSTEFRRRDGSAETKPGPFRPCHASTPALTFNTPESPNTIEQDKLYRMRCQANFMPMPQKNPQADILVTAGEMWADIHSTLAARGHLWHRMIPAEHGRLCCGR